MGFNSAFKVLRTRCTVYTTSEVLIISDALDLSLMGYYFVLFGKEVPTFRIIVSPSYPVSCCQCNATGFNIYTCIIIHFYAS